MSQITQEKLATYTPKKLEERRRNRKELRRQFSKVIQKLLTAQRQKVVKMTEMGTGGLRRTIMQPRYSKSRPSIERSRRLLPLLRRRRTSRIGGALCILPIIRYLFYNLHAYPGQTRRTRPRKGKRKLRPRRQRGKEELKSEKRFSYFS